MNIEKYSCRLLGQTVYYYYIKFNDRHMKCDTPLTLKRRVFEKRLIDQLRRYSSSIVKHIYSMAVPKTSYNLYRLLNKNAKYTYCIHGDVMVLATTGTNIIQDYMSKHVVLCYNGACVSGEMVLRDSRFIFDDNSGSYRPKSKHLRYITDNLSFLNCIIMRRNDTMHKYFFNT